MDEEERKREGWTQVSITGGQHLQRTLEMCEEMGFEVYLEEVNPEECGECTICYKLGDETIYRVYTRPRSSEESRDDEIGGEA
jgi:hypothetical protein